MLSEFDYHGNSIAEYCLGYPHRNSVLNGKPVCQSKELAVQSDHPENPEAPVTNIKHLIRGCHTRTYDVRCRGNVPPQDQHIFRTEINTEGRGSFEVEHCQPNRPYQNKSSCRAVRISCCFPILRKLDVTAIHSVNRSTYEFVFHTSASCQHW